MVVILEELQVQVEQVAAVMVLITNQEVQMHMDLLEQLTLAAVVVAVVDMVLVHLKVELVDLV